MKIVIEASTHDGSPIVRLAGGCGTVADSDLVIGHRCSSR